ncbi:MAG: hypothetical protein ACLFTK_10670, partial [Anaerolineales bacterium]
MGGIVTYVVLWLGRRAERQHHGLERMFRLYNLQQDLRALPPEPSAEQADHMHARLDALRGDLGNQQAVPLHEHERRE